MTNQQEFSGSFTYICVSQLRICLLVTWYMITRGIIQHLLKRAPCFPWSDSHSFRISEFTMRYPIWPMGIHIYLHQNKKRECFRLSFLILCPFLLSFFLPFWPAVLSYRSHLDVRDPIWGDHWSYNLHWYSPSCGFLSCKTNARRSVHSPRFQLIITLISWLTWHSGQVMNEWIN